MTWPTVALVVVAGVVGLVAVTLAVFDLVVHLRNWPLRPARRDQHPLYAESVLVQLQDGSAVAGVLTARVGEFLVLHNASLHEAGAQVAVDGAAWIPNSRIAWIQHQQANYHDGGER